MPQRHSKDSLPIQFLSCEASLPRPLQPVSTSAPSAEPRYTWPQSQGKLWASHLLSRPCTCPYHKSWYPVTISFLSNGETGSGARSWMSQTQALTVPLCVTLSKPLLLWASSPESAGVFLEIWLSSSPGHLSRQKQWACGREREQQE
jgi:hypothetical protein